MIKVCGVMLAVGLLAGCQTVKNKPDSSAPVSGVAASELIPEAAPAAAITTPPAQPKYGKLEARLLDQAELAFRSGNFFSPKHNNAFDRFHSVLLINPNNQEARAGIQAILLRYTSVARDAIGSGRLRSAQQYLHEVEMYFPGNSLVLDLKRKLREQQRKQRPPTEQLMSSEKTLEHEDITLSKAELKARTEAIVGVLSSIAERLQQSDESILIFARNDREGRWMYKTMKSAVDGYRIRGDIRISGTPKIRILPPL